MDELRDLPLSRSFQSASQTLPNPTADEIRTVMAEMGKLGPDDELNCGACGYDTCRAHAIAILHGLAEDEMCLPFTIERLKKTVQKLDLSNTKLASTQQALVQAEKLASMGQLAAGIAHEVNNPLGVVLLYAHVLLEACEKDSSLQKDMSMIVEQADRLGIAEFCTTKQGGFAADQRGRPGGAHPARRSHPGRHRGGRGAPGCRRPG